jgi:enamine deaminase RidA (YjgF/YER057c/UK114 family)
MTRTLTAAAALGLIFAAGAAGAKAPPPPKAEIVRTSANPAAVISSTATVPPGSKLIWLSGSTASPIDPAKPTELGDTKTQTLSILTKMKASLESMGLGMGDIIKMNVFLVGVPEQGGHMDSPGMNEVFKTFFGTAEQPNKPTRTTVQVAALGRPTTFVEIEAVVAKAP